MDTVVPTDLSCLAALAWTDSDHRHLLPNRCLAELSAPFPSGLPSAWVLRSPLVGVAVSVLLWVFFPLDEGAIES